MRSGVGFPGTREAVVVSIVKDRRGAGTGSPPEAVDVAPGVRRSEPQVLGWYRRAKATKRGGMGGEESECLIATAEAGELSPRDPVEGRGHRQVAPFGRERRPTHRGLGARLHVTTTDSRTGQSP